MSRAFLNTAVTNDERNAADGRFSTACQMKGVDMKTILIIIGVIIRLKNYLSMIVYCSCKVRNT